MEEPSEVKEVESEMQEIGEDIGGSTETVKEETIVEQAGSGKSIDEIQRMIEAALFLSASPLSIFDLLKLTGATLKEIKTAFQNLQNEYSARGSWLEMVRDGKSYLMRIQPSKVEKVESITQETELSKRALRVLAVVAQNDGVVQSKVFRKLGSTTYDGVKELIEKGYLIAEQKGHSKILHVSNKFKQYFGQAGEAIKKVKEQEAAAPDVPVETKSE